MASRPLGADSDFVDLGQRRLELILAPLASPRRWIDTGGETQAVGSQRGYVTVPEDRS